MKKIALVLSYFSLLLFFSFVGIGMYLGGEALNGKIEAGQHFLSWHGHYTPVSKNIYQYSYVHGIVAFSLIPISMAASFFFKPSAVELKWLNRATGVLTGLTIVYAAFLYF